MVFMQIRERDSEGLMRLELKMPPWNITKLIIPLLNTVLKHLLFFTPEPCPWCAQWKRTAHLLFLSDEQREQDTSISGKCFGFMLAILESFSLSLSHKWSSILSVLKSTGNCFMILMGDIHFSLSSHWRPSTVVKSSAPPLPILKCPTLIVAVPNPLSLCSTPDCISLVQILFVVTNCLTGNISLKNLFLCIEPRKKYPVGGQWPLHPLISNFNFLHLMCSWICQPNTLTCILQGPIQLLSFL